MAFDRLIENIVKTQNPSVVGLDPKLDYVPEYIKEKKFKKYGKTLKGAAKAIWEFNKTIIDEIHDICPAIKPQAAYYEMYGYEGVKTLYKTIQYAKEKGMFVMTDGKRNDIGATMEAYATAHLGLTDVGGELVEAFGADALTVNGYLGSDGINPLLDQCRKYDKGIFVLVKTSNKSSGELQDLMIGNKTVYATMGSMCELWGKDVTGKYGYSGVGAVVGATYPEQLAEMRKALHPVSTGCRAFLRLFRPVIGKRNGIQEKTGVFSTKFSENVETALRTLAAGGAYVSPAALFGCTCPQPSFSSRTRSRMMSTHFSMPIRPESRVMW